MNTLDAIYSRKSIRNFNGEKITESELNEILKTAYAAPIGRAMYDTLSIAVIENKEILDSWEKTAADVFGNPDMHPFYGAPTVILVSSVIGEAMMNNVNYSNAAIVVHNMALAATELGIGACHIWGAVGALGANCDLKSKLAIPENMVPCCAIALGKIDEKYEIRDIPHERIKTEFVK